jgi:hypothetical protein
MHTLLRCALAALLLWQGAAATLQQAREAEGTAAADLVLACTGTAAQRNRRVLGDVDAALVERLREVVPYGTVAVHQRVTGSLDELRRDARDEQELRAMLERLLARNRRNVELTVLSFPQPYLLGVDEPIALAEREAAAGRERWLFVREPDPEPADRDGWSLCHRAEGFSLWRFRKRS